MSVALQVLSAYSLALLGVAKALRALGRRSTSPWDSRTLAGHLRATRHSAEPPAADDWPHSEVSRLYGGIALVAALAAGGLSIGSLALHPDGAAVGVPLAVLVLAAISAVRIARSLR